MTGALLVLLGLLVLVGGGSLWSLVRARARVAELAAALAQAHKAVDTARREAEIARSGLESRLLAEGKRAEQAGRREGRAQKEVLRWQRAALGPYLLSQSLPLYPDRPCLIEFDAIVARIKGAAFVEAVAVADRAGLLLCRDEGDEGRALAAVAPVLASFAERALGGLTGLLGAQIVSDAVRHVSARPILALSSGTWVLASSSGRPVAPLAMDLAVSGALRYAGAEEGEGAPVMSLRGGRGAIAPEPAAAQGLLIELEAGLRATAALGLLVYQSGTVIAGQVYDGPAAPEAERLGLRLEELRQQLAWNLKMTDVVRLDLVTCGGVSLTYLAIQAGSPFALLAVSAGLPVDDLHLSALRGRLTRFLTMRPAAAPAELPTSQSWAQRRTVWR